MWLWRCEAYRKPVPCDICKKPVPRHRYSVHFLQRPDYMWTCPECEAKQAVPNESDASLDTRALTEPEWPGTLELATAVTPRMQMLFGIDHTGDTE